MDKADMKITIIYIPLIVLIFFLGLAGCIGAQTDDAARVVVNYYQALVNRDLNQLIASSCAEWESQARTDFNAFDAVKLELNNLQCHTTGEDGALKLVTCTGSIIANYGAEDQEINIADRTYQVMNEGGEWRMCGIR